MGLPCDLFSESDSLLPEELKNEELSSSSEQKQEASWTLTFKPPVLGSGSVSPDTRARLIGSEVDWLKSDLMSPDYPRRRT